MTYLDVGNLIMCIILALIVIPSCIFLTLLIHEACNPKEGPVDRDYYNYSTFKGKIRTEGLYAKLENMGQKNLDVREFTRPAYLDLQKIDRLIATANDLDFVFDHPRAMLNNQSPFAGEFVESALKYLRDGIMQNCREIVCLVDSCDKKIEDITLEDLDTEKLNSFLQDNKKKLQTATNVVTCYFKSNGKGGRMFDSKKLEKIMLNFDPE